MEQPVHWRMLRGRAWWDAHWIAAAGIFAVTVFVGILVASRFTYRHEFDIAGAAVLGAVAGSTWLLGGLVRARRAMRHRDHS